MTESKDNSCSDSSQFQQFKTIDTIGLKCPEPLMIVRREMRNLLPGNNLKVLADDPSTERDFKLLSETMGYQIISFEKEGSLLIYIINKA